MEVVGRIGAQQHHRQHRDDHERERHEEEALATLAHKVGHRRRGNGQDERDGGTAKSEQSEDEDEDLPAFPACVVKT